MMPPHAIGMTKPLPRAAADASWVHTLRPEEYTESNCFWTAALRGAAAALLARTSREQR